MNKHLVARAAWLPALFFWLLAGGQAAAQRVGPPWEQSIRLPAPVTQSFFIWLRPTANGYVATGNGQASPNFPHVLARYDTAGNVLWQRRGRVMVSGEQDLQPWGSGWVFVGARHGPPQSGGQVNTWPYLQKIRANGDTLPGVTYPDAASTGFLPSCVLPDRRGFTLVGYALERVVSSGLTPTRVQVLRTDTAGVLQWQRTYDARIFSGNAYGTDIIARANGGYLVTSTIQAGTSREFHPVLILIDSLGQERRRKVIVIKDSTSREQYNRIWGRTLVLPGGQGYVLNCRVDVPAPNRPGYSDNEAWVVAVDTALNVRWRTRLPDGRSPQTYCLRVYREPDGTLLAATYDEYGSGNTAQYSPYLYVHRLAATGQWLSRRLLLAAAATPYLRAWDWQPVAGDSVAVVCGSAPAGGRTPNAAWIARLRATTPRQVTGARGAAAYSDALQVYPNPAAGSTAQVLLPPGRGRGATLRVLDALGRPVHQQTLPAGAAPAEATVPLQGLPPGLYQVHLTAADGRRYVARLLRQ